MDLGLDKFQGLIDKVAKLPTNYRLALIFAIPLLLAGAYYHFLYGPEAEKVQQLRAQQQSLQRKLNEVRSVAGNLDAFEEELASLEAELAVAIRQLPNSKELPGLLTDITTLGKNAGLEFKAFRPQNEVPHGFYAEVPIEIEFNGTYHEVAMFFDRVAKLPRIVNIGDLRMDVLKESLRATTLKVKGKATTFRFLGGKGA